MSNFDIKRERRDLYDGRVGRFDVVEVPPMRFLMADGRGDPNTSEDYRRVLEALYTTSYAVRAMAKAELGRVHTVGPLEGLWYAEDLGVFTARDKDAWRWTMMIWQPEWVTADMTASAVEKVTTTKPAVAVDRIRCEEFSEGPAVQTLHVGPYDAEGPTIARMHEEIIPGHGLIASGVHHEIYLSDARKTDPARLRTIMRQPVARAAGQETAG
ncbi:MAG: GyrI-like domain-containing protein [Dietzia sp.]